MPQHKGAVPWNKGLSIDDPVIKAAVLKRKETMMAKYGSDSGRSFWKSEHPISELQRSRMSEAKKRNWKDSEFRRRQIEAQNRGKMNSPKFLAAQIANGKAVASRMWASPESRAQFRSERLPKMVAGWKASPIWNAKMRSPENMETLRKARAIGWSPQNKAKRLAALARGRIRKNTRIEIKLQEVLNKHGVQFLVGVSIGRIAIPDIQLTDSRTLIFADGCYWHGCPVHTKALTDRLVRQIAKDERQTRQLETEGWTVIRLWEHEIRQNPEVLIDRLKEKIPLWGLTH